MPIFEITNVNGPKAHSAFKWLRNNSMLKGGELDGDFVMFLLNAVGDEVLACYRSGCMPVDVVPDIVDLIGE